MSFTYGFYNSINNDRLYNAVQIAELFDGLIRDGVYATIGTSMIVRASNEANKVFVGVGRAWFNHTWSYNDSDMLLPGSESDLFLNRWDAIVLDIHSSDDSRTNSILWVTGNAATNPNKPSMIKEPGHYQYPLAYIYRKTNTSIINQEDITNMVGTSETPFVTGILDTLDIDNLLLQWRDQWAQFVLNYEQTATEWTNLQKTAFENYVEEFEAEMNAWLKEMKDALDGDVAGNLQNQINEIKDEIATIVGIINSKIGSDELNWEIVPNTLSAGVNLLWEQNKKFPVQGLGYLADSWGLEGLASGFKNACIYIKDSGIAPDVYNNVFFYGIVGPYGIWLRINIINGANTPEYALGTIQSYAAPPSTGTTWPYYYVYRYSNNSIDFYGYPINGANSMARVFTPMTQAQYNALSIKDGNTLYLITG